MHLHTRTVYNALIMHIHNDKDFLARQTTAQDLHATNSRGEPHFFFQHGRNCLWLDPRCWLHTQMKCTFISTPFGGHNNLNNNVVFTWYSTKQLRAELFYLVSWGEWKINILMNCNFERMIIVFSIALDVSSSDTEGHFTLQILYTKVLT